MKMCIRDRGIPVDNLYEDQDTEEVYNRLLYAASRQLFALVVGDAGKMCIRDRLTTGHTFCSRRPHSQKGFLASPEDPPLPDRVGNSRIHCLSVPYVCLLYTSRCV